MPDFAVTKQKQRSLALRMEMLGLLEEDIFEQFVKGSGKGGQKINKTSSCVILKHKPTGTTVKCQRERHLSLNRFLARRLLADRIEMLKTGTVRSKSQKRNKLKKQKRKRRKKALKKYHGSSQRTK